MVETSMMHGVVLSCSYFPKFSKLGNEGQLKEPGEKETALLTGAVGKFNKSQELPR